jgi:hypothetical protein
MPRCLTWSLSGDQQPGVPAFRAVPGLQMEPNCKVSPVLRWEYLIVDWDVRRRPRVAFFATEGAPARNWDHRETWTVWWPHAAKPEIRSCMVPQAQLAEDGWELVNATVTSYPRVADGASTWPNATEPTGLRWRFRRPIRR